MLELLSRAVEPAEVIRQRKQAAVALTDPVANARALDKIFLKAPGNLPV